MIHPKIHQKNLSKVVGLSPFSPPLRNSLPLLDHLHRHLDLVKHHRSLLSFRITKTDAKKVCLPQFQYLNSHYLLLLLYSVIDFPFLLS